MPNGRLQWQIQNNIPISQIPICTRHLPYNAPYWDRHVHTRAHFCCKMVHCGIWDWCIVGFVQQVYCFCKPITAALKKTSCKYDHLNWLSLMCFRSEPRLQSLFQDGPYNMARYFAILKDCGGINHVGIWFNISMGKEIKEIPKTD